MEHFCKILKRPGLEPSPCKTVCKLDRRGAFNFCTMPGYPGAMRSIFRITTSPQPRLFPTKHHLHQLHRTKNSSLTMLIISKVGATVTRYVASTTWQLVCVAVGPKARVIGLFRPRQFLDTMPNPKVVTIWPGNLENGRGWTR